MDTWYVQVLFGSKCSKNGSKGDEVSVLHQCYEDLSSSTSKVESMCCCPLGLPMILLCLFLFLVCKSGTQIVLLLQNILLFYGYYKGETFRERCNIFTPKLPGPSAWKYSWWSAQHQGWIWAKLSVPIEVTGSHHCPKAAVGKVIHFIWPFLLTKCVLTTSNTNY